MVENGTTLLKELYKNSKSDAVKVRALVGLCKLGASHGTDVSLRAFADGSTVKLAKQCRRLAKIQLLDAYILLCLCDVFKQNMKTMLKVV